MLWGTDLQIWMVEVMDGICWKKRADSHLLIQHGSEMRSPSVHTGSDTTVEVPTNNLDSCREEKGRKGSQLR